MPKIEKALRRDQQRDNAHNGQFQGQRYNTLRQSEGLATKMLTGKLAPVKKSKRKKRKA
jgi:hypothetical protein